MKLLRSLVFLFVVFVAIYIAETSVVKRDAGEEPDEPYPGCGRRPLKNEKRKRSISEPEGTNNTTTGGNLNIEHVIVGGQESEPNTWPWMVALIETDGSWNGFLCGGSLISKQYVLTAAHCFVDDEKNIDVELQYYVLVGAHNVKGSGDSFDPENTIVHPNYDPKKGDYDIAIIKLEEEVTFDDNILPVCLDFSGVEPENKEVTVTGWGRPSTTSLEASEVLREAQLEIVPLEECRKAYSSGEKKGFLVNGMTKAVICAGLEDGSKDACQGDSGGPLVFENTNKIWYQIGLVSFGEGCAVAGSPGVYTRISAYKDWISDNSDVNYRTESS